MTIFLSMGYMLDCAWIKLGDSVYQVEERLLKSSVVGYGTRPVKGG